MGDSSPALSSLRETNGRRREEPHVFKFGTHHESSFAVLLNACATELRYGVIGALAVWSFMMIFTLRIFLYIPRAWGYLPPALQHWVASQQGALERGGCIT